MFGISLEASGGQRSSVYVVLYVTMEVLPCPVSVYFSSNRGRLNVNTLSKNDFTFIDNKPTSLRCVLKHTSCWNLNLFPSCRGGKVPSHLNWFH